MRILLIGICVAILILVSCPENRSSSNNAVQDSATSSLNYNTSIGALIYVPAGSFQRDSTSTKNISQVSAFRISEKEITQKQFSTIVGSIPSQHTAGDDHPVENVNWYHTLVFCNKLSQLESLTPVYSIKSSTDPANWGSVPTSSTTSSTTSSDAAWNAVVADWNANGYRLPTEMEWLWAAMGATSGFGYSGSGVYTTGYSKAFAGSTGSNNAGDYVWYSSNSEKTTHPVGTNPVGTKLPNELGLFDMNGNVWEWCWDRDGYPWPMGTLNDYRGSTTGPSRVNNGAGWDYGKPSQLRSSSPTYVDSSLGFRVIRL